MCGLFGRFESKSTTLFNPDVWVSLTHMLQHRGPDEGGYWHEGPFFLGHCRLSIIDLVTGKQPMASEDGRFVIAFNGEIYNYLELEEELTELGHSFKSRSDTEVILAGYREWGPEVTCRLIGMFAIALVDRKARTLFLARDRFGEKPLFYYESSDGTVSFASELRALSHLPDIERRVDLDALGSYLCLNYVPGDKTLMNGIKRLPPGTWKFYQAGQEPRTAQYWSLPNGQRSTSSRIDLETALEELRQRLDSAVRIALRSDVPVALFLSGGIDSSVVAESAVRQGMISRAYCLDIDEPSYSEWDNARFVAERLNLPLQRVRLSSSALDDFLSVVWHADDPLADSSALAVWTLAKEAGRDSKVIISGDGGDELFGGYLTYKATALHRFIISRLPGPVRKILASLADHIPCSDAKVSPTYKLMRFLRAANLPSREAHFAWNGTWLPHVAASLLQDEHARGFAESALSRMAGRHQLGLAPNLLELQRADIHDYLPNDILTKVDRMTMAHGLEARAPLLNPEVAEFAFSLPTHLKLPPFGKPKRLLRELAMRMYGPRIGAAKKKGFSIPIHQWLRGPGRDRLESLLSRTQIQSTGLFNVDEVLRAKTEHLTGRKPLGFELWGLMVCIAWYQQHLTLSPVQRRHEIPLTRLVLPPLRC